MYHSYFLLITCQHNYYFPYELSALMPTFLLKLIASHGG